MYCLTQFLWVSYSRMAYMRWFWPQVPYEVMVKVSGHSRGCRQEDSVPCWLLAGGLSYSARGTLHRAAFHGMAVDSPQNE